MSITNFEVKLLEIYVIAYDKKTRIPLNVFKILFSDTNDRFASVQKYFYYTVGFMSNSIIYVYIF